METNTLYYTFSTIPQVLGAMVAILAAFVHFRIIRLQDYLIGDGEAVLHRWGETGYIFDEKLNEKYKKRLIDAIHRKNIFEIKEVIRKLRDIEIEEGYTRSDRPTGLQYSYEDRFLATLKRIKNLKTWTLIVSGLAIVTITSSLLCLALVDKIIVGCCSGQFSIFFNLFLTILTLVVTFYVLFMGLTDNTKYECDRD